MIEQALSPDVDDLSVSAMAYPHFRSQFGDTTHTKVFVGGLAWETPTEEMRSYFVQFGEILEAVIITDKNSGKSKGYGFVTFRDPESARRACSNPNPVIDGRRANCNIASLGRPRPSPPRGITQESNPHQTSAVQGASSYGGIRAGVPPPPPPAVMHSPYGYPTYAPDYSYHQALYNPQVQQPQYFHQLYGASSSSSMGSPFYYGYSIPASPRGTFATPSQTHRLAPPPYIYYPPQLEGSSFSTYPPTLQQQPILLLPSSDSQSSQQSSQHNPTEMEAGVVSSETPNT